MPRQLGGTNKLATVMIEEQVSQMELAYKTDISQSTIAKYCNGRITPSVENAKKIAKVLGRPVEEVF